MNLTVLTAVGGGIAAFWKQIQSALEWLKSLVIITATIDEGLKYALLEYLWAHMWTTRSGLKRYNAYEMYVRPKNRYSLVAFETFGEAMVFFHGWKPLFLTTDTKEEGEYGQAPAKISYLRGMFHTDQLIKAAVAYHNKQNEKAEANRRYMVRKFFGKSGGEQGGVSPNGHKKGGSGLSRHTRPLGWDVRDLGLPIENEPFGLLYYSQEVLSFVDHVRRWSASQLWYEERGIPWRLGALLHGIPGTGKTSFARAAAQELGMPIYILDLVTLGNEELVHYWAEALEHAPAMILIEDIDRIFNVDQNIKGGTLNKPGLTMDCLLNCISGAEPSDGLLVLVTANATTKLDQALTRPGRLDRILVFEALTEDARWKLATRILPKDPQLVKGLVGEGDGDTGAQFTRRCTDLALGLHWEAEVLKLRESGNGKEDKQKEEVRAGS